MLQLFSRIEEAASSEASIIIQGETGTGKELVAEALHELSPRSAQPYVVVDCAAIPAELIESEMFGHTKGSFTGAFGDRKGAFEAANAGTIFIDEIGELPLDLQPRLLRVLEKQQIKRVGAVQTRDINVRVVAATNRDLRREVEDGRFREDLYFRLNVVKLSLPALRERPDDIVFLAQRFLADVPGPNGPIELTEPVKRRLRQYEWPGNVRELRNLIDRGAAMSDAFFRMPDDFGRSLELDGAHGAAPGSGVGLSVEPLRAPKPTATVADPGATNSLTHSLWQGRPYKQARDAVMADFEQAYIRALLDAHEGNVSAAAREAEIHRNVFHRMMARYGIDR